MAFFYPRGQARGWELTAVRYSCNAYQCLMLHGALPCPFSITNLPQRNA